MSFIIGFACGVLSVPVAIFGFLLYQDWRNNKALDVAFEQPEDDVSQQDKTV